MVITQPCLNCGTEIEFEAEDGQSKPCPQCGITNSLPERKRSVRPIAAPPPPKDWQPQYICATCHSQVRPQRTVRGWISLEIVLWLNVLWPVLAYYWIAVWSKVIRSFDYQLLPLYASVATIPALMYSLWRRSGPARACSECGSADLIPASSPAAKSIQTGSIYGNRHGNS